MRCRIGRVSVPEGGVAAPGVGAGWGWGGVGAATRGWVAYRGGVSPSVPSRAAAWSEPVPPRRAAPRPAAVLAVAALVVVLAGVGVRLLWRGFVTTTAGQRVDQLAMVGALHGRTRLWRLAEPLLEPVSVTFVAVTLVATVAIAVLRRRWTMAFAVAVLIGGANLTTQLLKYAVLQRPDLQIGGNYGNTLPSGHTTVAVSVSAALLFVVPPRGRPAVALLGVVYGTATGWSTLVGQWHRPSDVVAAVLVTLAWFAVACALLVLVPRREQTATRLIAVVGSVRGTGARAVAAVLVVVGVAAGLVAALALGASWGLGAGAGTRQELVAYGGAVVGVFSATALGFALMIGLREAAGSTGRGA